MAVKVADKIVQMNGQNYPLMDASAVEYEDINGNTTNVKESLDYLYNMPNTGGGQISIALEQPVSVDIEEGNSYVKLKWTDPNDVIVGSTTLAAWKKTVIVRKEGSAPSSVSDGTIVVESTTRNEYSETPYIDDGLVNGTIYYYGIFPCTTENVYTTTYSVSAMPSDNIINGIKIVTFADGTDEEIVRMIQGHYNDEINIADYWSIGDMRTIHIDAMQANSVGEAHSAQNMPIVIIGIEHDDLKTEINGHTKAAITVQCKATLKNDGYINSTNTNSGGWEECARRKWCNDVFYNALSTNIRTVVKQVVKKNFKVYNDSTISTTDDYCYLLSETEVFGKNKLSVADTEGDQYEYYKTESNRIKAINVDSGGSVWWWVRSPSVGWDSDFCRVSNSGIADTTLYASFKSYIAPAFSL